ncbi:MAG: NADPH-dependent F420 reductase [Candidatus Heimdallarchaeota archaeon]|nr:NADPH-dependent F420 reductase [Candidatus Heimdallarchaeota archaeon]
MTRKIGLIPGTGSQGQGIALRLALAGYDILIGSRKEEKAKKVAKELNTILEKEKIQATVNENIAQKCDLIFIILPYEFLEETLKPLREIFQEGTIIVDVVVPLAFDKGLAYIPDDVPKKSASELIEQILPKNIAIVGAFKTISAITLRKINQPMEIDLFLTSNNQEAKNEVKEILEKIPGIRGLDAGPLWVSRTIERMTALVINLNKRNKELEHASFRVISSNK